MHTKIVKSCLLALAVILMSVFWASIPVQAAGEYTLANFRMGGYAAFKSIIPVEKNKVKVTVYTANDDTLSEGAEIYAKESSKSNYSLVGTIRFEGKQTSSGTVTLKGNCYGKTYDFMSKVFITVNGKKEYGPEPDYDTVLFGLSPQSIKAGFKELIDAKIVKYDKKTNQIIFGKYDFKEIDPDTDKVVGDGKKEDISWRVLNISEDGKSALLITDKIVDFEPYGGDYNAPKAEDKKAHKDKENRHDWLNTCFYNEAFTEEQQKHIALSSYSANEQLFDTKGTLADSKLWDRATFYGKVFFISRKQTKEYFPSYGQAAATTYNGNEAPYLGRSLGYSDCDLYFHTDGYYEDVGWGHAYWVGYRPCISISLDPGHTYSTDITYHNSKEKVELISAESTRKGVLTLHFYDYAGANGYYVYYALPEDPNAEKKTNQIKSFIIHQTSAVTVVEHTYNINLNPDTSKKDIMVRMVAVDKNGLDYTFGSKCSDWIPVAMATSETKADPLPLDTVIDESSVKLSYAGDSRAKLEWKTLPGITYYEVQSVQDNRRFTLASSTIVKYPTTDKLASVKFKIAEGKPYRYRIRALNDVKHPVSSWVVTEKVTMSE